MNKILPILVVGILVLSGLGAVALPSDKILVDSYIKENEQNNVPLDDELDQSQTNYDEKCPGPVGYIPFNTSWNVSIAQSFTPTKEILTRVVLYAGKNATTSYPYVLAIRDNRTGENLALASVNPDEFMVFPNISWIEFDFDDIIISIGETYYMVSYTSNVTDNFYVWGANCSDIYPNGTAHVSLDGGETWQTAPDADLCFMTYGREPTPDLDCDGELSWTDVKPGDTVTGSFTVENIGDPGSLLDWKIESYPDWGDWTFTPSSGDDLTPEDGQVTINVSVIAPDEKNKQFTGNVTVCNQDDPTDCCTIPVSLTTPKNKPFNFNFNLLSWLFERFPNAFPILRYVLEL
ncbi:MAG: hypothetical protein JSW60_08720 [Thermoplasmatales archaeon]|nr:MAG: hypothetical protein JSW60_08720 [Thermoplasmatales archaeon]